MSKSNVSPKFSIGDKVVAKARIRMRKRCMFCNGDYKRALPVFKDGEWTVRDNYCQNCEEGYIEYDGGTIEVIATITKINFSLVSQDNAEADEEDYKTLPDGTAVRIEYNMESDEPWVDYVPMKLESEIHKLLPVRAAEIRKNIEEMLKQYKSE